MRGLNGKFSGVGVCAAERAAHCCETLHALIVDTMTQVINGLIPARHIQCAKIANIPDIRNPHPHKDRLLFSFRSSVVIP